MKPLILIVDHDADNRELYCTYLAHEGFECISAGDGHEALRLIRERVPALVLLEVVLPGVDGWDLVTRIKADPLLRSIRVVIFTSEAYPAHRERAAEAQADGFLPKPAAPQDVVYVIRALLEIAGTDPPATIQ